MPLGFAILLFLGTHEPLSPLTCRTALAAGRAALDGERLADASEAFSFLVRQCRSANAHNQIDYDFYLALSEQLRAESPGQISGDREQHLAAAAGGYQAVIAADPDRSAAYLNLAEVYVSQHDYPRAADMFLSGIKRSGGNPWYYGTYAKFLVSEAQYEDATNYIDKALSSDQNCVPAHTAAVMLRLSQKRSIEALKYVQELFTLRRDTGRTVAIAALQAPGWGGHDRDFVLISIVRTLAHETYFPRDFARSDLGRSLVPLENDELVGAAVREVLELHTQATAAATYPWWFRDDDLAKTEDRRGAFLDLAISLASRLLHAGRLAEAEQYYLMIRRIAVDYRRNIATLGLAEVYTTARRIDALTAVVESYDKDPTTVWNTVSKSPAERAQQLLLRYQFEREVGILFSTFSSTDTSSVAKAVVDHAHKAGRAAQEYSQIDTIEPFNLDYVAILAAANAYHQLGDESAAAKTELDAAEDCLRRGNYLRAKQILVGVRRDMLTSSDEGRLNDMLRRAGH